MNIRRATLGDARQMCDILNEIIAIGGTTAYLSPRTIADFDRILDENGAFAHVVDMDGEILAYQWITPLDPPSHAQIATFAKPGTVQRGMGSALFPHTAKTARDASYQDIDATIRADNTGGLAYYSKMGFQDIGVTKAKPLSDGTPVDRVHKLFTL